MNITINEITKYRTEIIIEDKNGKCFKIQYAAGDIYWTMLDYYPNNKFTITPEDEILYNQLEEIFAIIKNNENKFFTLLKDNTFYWLSENYGLNDVSNKLTIEKKENDFIISFWRNPQSYDKSICPICFCLSGSRNQKVANSFSIMFYNIVAEINANTKKLKK